jgi:hypothetical protein
MQRHVFIGEEADLADLYRFVRGKLQSEGFDIEAENAKDGFLELHARVSGRTKNLPAKVRDVSLVILGDKDKFEVQLNVAILDRHDAITIVEEIVTVGLAVAVNLLSAHQFEENLWEEIVHRIDSSLNVCPIEGLVFRSESELTNHMKTHELGHQVAEERMMNLMSSA